MPDMIETPAPTPKNQPQIFPNPYVAHCSIYNCRKRASWFIGRPDGPLNVNLPICDDCMQKIIASVPGELLPYWKPADNKDSQEYDTEKPGPTYPKNESGLYPCPECGQEFKNPANVAMHMKHKHNGGSND